MSITQQRYFFISVVQCQFNLETPFRFMLFRGIMLMPNSKLNVACLFIF